MIFFRQKIATYCPDNEDPYFEGKDNVYNPIIKKNN